MQKIPQFTEKRPEIPVGDYCYALRSCPHLKSKIVAGGVAITYCNAMKIGSIPNGTSAEDYAKLEQHYGTSPWTNPETGEVLSVINDHPEISDPLLWDSIKVCSWNPGNEDYGYDSLGPDVNDFHMLTVEGNTGGFEVAIRVQRRQSDKLKLETILRQLRALPRRLLANGAVADSGFLVKILRESEHIPGERLAAMAPASLVGFAVRVLRCGPGFSRPAPKLP